MKIKAPRSSQSDSLRSCTPDLRRTKRQALRRTESPDQPNIGPDSFVPVGACGPLPQPPPATQALPVRPDGHTPPALGVGGFEGLSAPAGHAALKPALEAAWRTQRQLSARVEKMTEEMQEMVDVVSVQGNNLDKCAQSAELSKQLHDEHLQEKAQFIAQIEAIKVEHHAQLCAQEQMSAQTTQLQGAAWQAKLTEHQQESKAYLNRVNEQWGAILHDSCQTNSRAFDIYKNRIDEKMEQIKSAHFKEMAELEKHCASLQQDNQTLRQISELAQANAQVVQSQSLCFANTQVSTAAETNIAQPSNHFSEPALTPQQYQSYFPSNQSLGSPKTI